MKKYKVAIIGLGHQANEDHIPAVESCNDVELVAVSDVDSHKIGAFKKEHPSVATYLNYKDVFKKHKLDFIIICTPHFLHADIVKNASENGVHILKEKPFAMSFKEALEIDEISKKTGIKIMVTMQRRFNPIYSTFFQLIDKIGDIFFIDSRYTIFTENPASGWRGDKKTAGGGCLMDMGYHMVDLLIWFFGLPDRVAMDYSCSAFSGCKYDAEDTAIVNFHYNKDRNIAGLMLISRVISPKQEFCDFYGTNGKIHLERGKIERFELNGRLIESLSRDNQWASAPLDQLNYFLKVIRNEKENIGSSAYHLNHLAFIEAAYLASHKTGFVNPNDLIKKYV